MTHRLIPWLGLLFLLPLPALVPAAESWHRFRGPAGDGHADLPAAPLRWSASQNVVWKSKLEGEGWSSPVVSGQTVYLTAAVSLGGDNNDYSLRLIALDGRTGKRKEDVEVFRQEGATAPKIHSKNSHASPTPLIDGQRIFVHFGHQGTACVSLERRILWENRELDYQPVHGNGGSPILVGNRLIFSCDGREDPFVVALDKNNGKVLWKTPRQTDARKTFSFSTPTLIEVEHQPQVISPGSNVVCALDPQDGREIWRVRYEGYSVVPKPVYGHGLVFVSTSFDRAKLLAIRVGGRGDVTDTHVAWELERGAPHTPSPLLVGDYLFVVSDRGIATCLDARSGETRWQERLGGNYSASPLLAGGKIYFQSEEGRTTVVAAEPTFRKLAENELGERTLASFAVIDNDFLIRGQEHLFRITTHE